MYLQNISSSEKLVSPILPNKSENNGVTDKITVTAQEKICSTCQKSQVKKFLWRCKVVYYCDANCQKTDWPKHKTVCHPPTKVPQGLTYNPALETIINKIVNSNPALDLLKKVLNDGPISIQIGETITEASWSALKTFDFYK